MKKILLPFLLLLSSLSPAQSIPNAGFENWTNMGAYLEPDGWATLNSLTAPFTVLTVTRATPGNPGNYYIKVTSRSAGTLGVVPGIAVSGSINSSTLLPESGFPFSLRPASLNGSWQHMIFGTSQGYIDVLLSRWDGNQRIPVASAHRVLVGMAMSWANFSIPLVYTDGNNPDSCMIVLSASGAQPFDDDYLWVDNLSFNGTVTGLENPEMKEELLLYPNPPQSQLTLSLSDQEIRMLELNIRDLMGRSLILLRGLNVSGKAEIDIRHLPAGTYVVSATTTLGIISRKFTKFD
ncbi:MAG: T9SS type A sorting domain-containing protein [Bacteroidia bacterium]|nr:T9SS type A sorting domain-containing protein [Bacteroidia bacterium]